MKHPENRGSSSNDCVLDGVWGGEWAGVDFPLWKEFILSTMENISTQDAANALASIDQARSEAAARLTTPWWYHPILGLLAAVFVVAYTIGGLGVMIAVAVVYFLGLGILMGAYKKQTGVWINGLKAGKATWWTLPLVVIMVAGMGAAFYFHVEHGLNWPAWVAGALVFIAVNVFGRRFDGALRSQLRGKS